MYTGVEKEMAMPDYITVKEAASLANFGIEYIRELLRSGQVAGKKFGWQWMVDRQSLEEYLRRRGLPPPPK